MGRFDWLPLPQPPEVIEAYGSDLTDMMLHRQFAVDPNPEITHNISAVNGRPANRQRPYSGRDLCKASTSAEPDVL